MNISTALIPYASWQAPPEFVCSEVKKGVNLSHTLSEAMASASLQRANNPLALSDRNILCYSSLEEFGALKSLSNDIDVTLHGLSFDQAPKSVSQTASTIAEVFQSEAAFTIATDKKPIIAAHGCGSCVAAGGYDPTNQLAFIVYFSTPDEVTQCGDMIFHNISQLAKKRFEVPIQLHLRGGLLLEETSAATIQAIKTWMTWRKDIPMEIASEDILDNSGCSRGKSLSIDSRTGVVTEYDPMANAARRTMSQSDALHAIMSALHPNITVAYTAHIK